MTDFPPAHSPNVRTHYLVYAIFVHLLSSPREPQLSVESSHRFKVAN